MRLLTAFEHGWLEVGEDGDLHPREVEALTSAAAHLPPGCLQWGHRALKFTQFCGVVQIDGVQIEILPKLYPYQTHAQQRNTLLTMLSQAGDLEGLETMSAGLATSPTTLLDLFIRHFARLLEHQLRQGMLRDYRDIDDNLDQMRGRIDVVRQQRENLFKPQRIACRFSELIVDIPINRLLHSALYLVSALATSPLLKARLRSLRTRFSSVGTLMPHEQGPESSELNRMEQRYATLVDLAHLFLDGQFLDPRSGHQRAFSLLFNMNQLFERYAASLLRPIARRQGLRLVEQRPRRYLGYDETGRGRLLMRPDIAFLDRESQPVAILDAKWKRIEAGDPLAGISPADLYQLSSYADAYRCFSVGLLYPEQTWLVAGETHALQLDSSTPTVMTLQAIPLDSPESSRVANIVKTYLNCEHNPLAASRV